MRRFMVLLLIASGAFIMARADAPMLTPAEARQIADEAAAIAPVKTKPSRVATPPSWPAKKTAAAAPKSTLGITIPASSPNVLVLPKGKTGPEPAVIVPSGARQETEDAINDLVSLNQNSADAYFHSGDWKKSVEMLNRTIGLNPVGTDSYALAAWLLWSTGKTAEALDFYNRMIIANPNDPNAFFEYGFYYVTQKNDAEAITWLKTAVALGLPSPKRHLYGHALERLGRNDEALVFWRKVLTEDPKDEVAQREYEKLSQPAIESYKPPMDAPAPTPAPGTASTPTPAPAPTPAPVVTPSPVVITPLLAPLPGPTKE